eukprot:TRINITY_DN5591_c0_g1_i2.p1 TRINITY_DN5591_c0_g1~~TRINITY_DN5591_c0_g1_i2.p1  ORF type:complete len:222 (-),score=40.97 TRINITY_DN5591_c0_g1_i2:68-733(-)
MGILQPAPAVVGSLSLAAVVGAICFVHFLICVSVLASVSSEKSVQVGSVMVSSTLQCVIGAFCLVGIPIIVHASIGTLFRVPSHLTAYIFYMFLSMIGVAVFFMEMAKHEHNCVTQMPDQPGGMATMVCGIPSVGTFFMMLIVLLFICVAIYLVWSMNENIRRRTETDLFRYQEPLALQAQMAHEAQQYAAMQDRQAAELAYGMKNPGAQWSPAPMGYGTH